MNDDAIKKEPSESPTEDGNNLTETTAPVTTESSAKECSTMSATEHDASTLAQVNRESQSEDITVQNSCNNIEGQINASQGNQDTIRKILENASSQPQPVAELLVRVKPEPSDITESTKQPNTNEDYLGNTIENAQTSPETASAAITPQADNATALISTEPNTSSPLIEEAAGAASTLVETVEGLSLPTTMDSMTGELPENITDTEQTPAQSVIEASITGVSTIANVSVKPEPDSVMPETIPDDFFDDLLDNADQLTAELSPMHVGGVEPQQHSQNADDVSEATQSVENINNSFNKTARNVSNQATDTERIRIKHEPPTLSERNEVPAGDEQDFIATPRSSPQRSGVEETTSSSAAAGPQIRVKNEENQEDDSGCSEEPIPDNFFDELLDDCVPARVVPVENESQEMKYAYQLEKIREKLRRLEETGQDPDDAREKSNSSRGHKHKNKKSKKKSRKRARSERRKESEAIVDNCDESRHISRKRRRSRSSNRELEEIETSQFNTNYGNLQKVPLPPPPAYSQPTSTAYVEPIPDNVMFLPKPIMVKPEPSVNCEPIPLYADDDNEDVDLDCLPVRASSKRTTAEAGNMFSGFKKIKLEKPASKPAEPLILTPAMKRQKALRLASETIQQFQGAKCQSSFYFASTVRKLPTSSSFVTQQSYENRSPLHTIHNVRYTFNSHSTRFNLQEWGLEALPKIAAKVARTVGCDADTLCAKLQSAKLSTKYNRIKREPDDNSELIEETKSSFFTNAMTQTDDVYVLTARRRNANDIGVQVSPISGDIATQTTASSSSMTSTNDDLPLMQLINVLNENQLLALNDFAELIREPAETALDMYRLRTRMQDIFKCSQLPSAMPAATIDAPARMYETAPRSLPNSMDYRQQQPQQPQQQQTHRFASRDPRASTSNNIPIFARLQVDPRLNPAAVQQQRQVQYQGLPPQQRQLSSSTGAAPTKNYGRGNVRR